MHIFIIIISLMFITSMVKACSYIEQTIDRVGSPAKARCSTDGECAELCAILFADDPSCDGGPAPKEED